MLGAFMPHLPTNHRVNESLDLPEAAGNSFWLHGSAWPLPEFDNADTFIARLMREGLLVRDPVVEDVLRGGAHAPIGSLRSLQRRFLRTTGLTYSSIQQIERAQQALTLLQQGVSILDTVEQIGYADQPHLTRSLRR